MKYIVHKMCYDYEKEEQWLNEMAAKGMALTDYSWCRYVFEDCANGEYLYRIELLKEKPSHPENMAYFRFLEETGVEFVASYLRWVYFRKKAADGAFELYSDIDSKIKHYRRINTLWSTLACMEFAIACLNIAIGLENLSRGYTVSQVNLVLGLLLLPVGLSLLALGSPLRKKIKKLKLKRTIQE